MAIGMRKLEKVNGNVIRIIVEKANEVPLAQILDNEKQLLAQKRGIEDTLKHIAEIKAEAKKLGITAKKLEPIKKPIK